MSEREQFLAHLRIVYPIDEGHDCPATIHDLMVVLAGIADVFASSPFVEPDYRLVRDLTSVFHDVLEGGVANAQVEFAGLLDAFIASCAQRVRGKIGVVSDGAYRIGDLVLPVWFVEEKEV